MRFPRSPSVCYPLTQVCGVVRRMLRLPTLLEHEYTGPEPLVGSLADWRVIDGQNFTEQTGGQVYSDVYKLAVVEAGPVDFRGISSVFPNLQALLVTDEQPNSTDIRGVVELAATLTHLADRHALAHPHHTLHVLPMLMLNTCNTRNTHVDHCVIHALYHVTPRLWAIDWKTEPLAGKPR